MRRAEQRLDIGFNPEDQVPEHVAHPARREQQRADQRQSVADR